MAGPYNAKLLLSNGQRLDVYCAATQAVGVYSPVDVAAPAVATSPQQFEVASNCDIIGWKCDPLQLLGQFEIMSGGRPTGIFLDTTAEFSNNNAANVTDGKKFNVALRAGITYRLLTRKAMSA
jgi:hypothetical protein